MNFILMFLTFVHVSTTCSAECPYSNQQILNLRGNCSTATYDERTNKKYVDDVGFDFYWTSFYITLTKMLTFNENTPQYCVAKDSINLNFTINFDSNIKNRTITAELVTCRSDGFWTNGREFCIPSECNFYLNQKGVDYFVEDTVLSFNLNDVNALNVSGDVTLMNYVFPSDPRFIFNITSNTSQFLDTDDFLDLCSKYGPCKGGRFLGTNDTLYAKGGYPSFVLKKDGRRNTIFIAVRHDPRPFVTREKDAPCPIGNRNFSVCSSSFGTQSIKKLWEKNLPFNKEWLKLHIRVKFSYKDDCTIWVWDKDTDETLVNFKGPCGRYADMKRGNWPIRKIGLSTRSMQSPLKMRYRDIEVFFTTILGNVFTGKK